MANKGPMQQAAKKLKQNVGKTNKAGFAPVTNSATKSKFGKTK